MPLICTGLCVLPRPLFAEQEFQPPGIMRAQGIINFLIKGSTWVSTPRIEDAILQVLSVLKFDAGRVGGNCGIFSVVSLYP